MSTNSVRIETEKNHGCSSSFSIALPASYPARSCHGRSPWLAPIVEPESEEKDEENATKYNRTNEASRKQTLLGGAASRMR